MAPVTPQVVGVLFWYGAVVGSNLTASPRILAMENAEPVLVYDRIDGSRRDTLLLLVTFVALLA